MEQLRHDHLERQLRPQGPRACDEYAGRVDGAARRGEVRRPLGGALHDPRGSRTRVAQRTLRTRDRRDITVTFYEAEPPARTTKRITIAYRDHGCGITPSEVASTIFAIGSSHKSKSAWQQGAFGLGGASTYRNAEAIVLVTRRAAEINPRDDRITVTVVMWQAHGKGQTAYYLTTTQWEDAGDTAEPWSAPASEFPDFEPGTYLALISYGVEGYHRARLGDERSFDTTVNTRLFQPITPVRFTNTMVRADRNEYLRGLQRRLEDNPRADRLKGADKLPYHIDGVTYHLPVHFYVFSAPGEAGERRNFIAYDHAFVFTSNGQVHHHWTPQEFRYKTQLNKLYDRVFVVVETDELPIEVRTSLFTPDRSRSPFQRQRSASRGCSCGVPGRVERARRHQR